MIRIEAVPLKEINGIKFGMKRDEVRNILGEAREFKKSRFSKSITDDFGYCHVFYDDNDACEAIEFFGDCEIKINEKTIFPTDMDNVKEIIGDLIEDEGSYISVNQSIGIYAPLGKMESILFGVEEYYK